MRRPRDWHPLADRDPVPGDPGAILDEVAHMKRVAAMLRREAADLRLIGEGEGLEGRYANALRDGARGLDVRLRETAERYERVHGHLTGWAHELQGFQSEADRILGRARAEATAVSTGDGVGTRDDAGSGDAGGSADGVDPLDAHRVALAKVEAQRDERARHYAGLIGRQIDDTIKDSPWERLKDAVDDFQDVISLVVDVMSWAATIIAVTALLTTPAGWVAGLAVWLSVGVLAGHLLLASAGDGSWADLGMDVFGLLTMHVGNVALAELRSVRNATKLAAEAAAEESAAANSARATQALRDRASAVVNRRGTTRAARAKARHDRNIARAANRRAGRQAAAAESATPMPEASRWEVALMGGEKESRNMHKDIQRMRAAYPENAAVQRASRGAEAHKRKFQATWVAATTTDGWDKGAGSSDIFPGKWQYGPYGDLKGRYTKEVGSNW